MLINNWKIESDLNGINAFILFFLLFYTIVFIPFFIVSIQYIKENKATLFTLVGFKKGIDITVENVTKKYSYEDIKHCTFHRSTLSRNQMWSIFIFINLGYCDLEFKNGDRYFLSSFLFNLRLKRIFPDAKTKFHYLPFINRNTHFNK